MSETVVAKSETDSGTIELIESQVDGSLHVVSITDSRDKVVDPVYSRTANVSFIFDVDVENQILTISRIFANSERGGGSAIDTKPSLISDAHTSTYKYTKLLDSESLGLLHREYPSYYISLRRIRDKLYKLIQTGELEF